MNTILKQAQEVYKNRETEYYLETIRKTADELEQLQAKHETLKKDVARFIALLHKAIRQTQTTKEKHEFWELQEKLSKEGKL